MQTGVAGRRRRRAATEATGAQPRRFVFIDYQLDLQRRPGGAEWGSESGGGEGLGFYARPRPPQRLDEGEGEDGAEVEGGGEGMEEEKVLRWRTGGMASTPPRSAGL